MQATIPGRKEFDTIYDSFAPLIYGIACRITRDADQREKILAKSFEELCRRENTQHINSLGIRQVLAAAFKGIHAALSGSLPPEEIQCRIQEEQDRLLQGFRWVPGGLQKFAVDNP